MFQNKERELRWFQEALLNQINTQSPDLKDPNVKNVFSNSIVKNKPKKSKNKLNYYLGCKEDIVIGLIKLIDGLEEGLIKKKKIFFHQKRFIKLLFIF